MATQEKLVALPVARLMEEVELLKLQFLVMALLFQMAVTAFQ